MRETLNLDVSSLFNWLEPNVAQTVHRVLENPMPRGRGTLVYRKRPGHLGKKRVDGKIHIVFTGYYPYASLLKKSMTLRRTGRYYTTLLAVCVREDASPFTFFDECFEVSDYWELLNLLMTCDAHSVHAFIQPWIFGALAVSAKRHTGVRTVVEVNDSMLFVDRNACSPACRMEAEILRNADHFTHKMPEKAIGEMRGAWRLGTPDTLLHCLPVTDFFQDCRPLGNGEPKQLVFAGGVMPYHIAMAKGHEGHLFDPLIETAGRCRAGLDFLVNRNARNMFWDEHERYIAMSERYPNFKFLKGVSLHELPRRMSVYHLAVYYENSANSSYNPKHFEYNMATKIFSYIEAGLPVLVPQSATYINDFLKDSGMGIEYELPDLSEVLDLLDEDKHHDLCMNVARYRADNNMTSVLPALKSLYE